MENIFVLALIISVVFIMIKFVEMRFITKEDRPLKELIKEGIQIYLSSVLALYIATQFDVVQLTDLKVSKGGGNVSVFVDNPDF
jgi:uncharacterized PurR-regulated membrane protein YhhQ (DUF165 family)